MWIGSSRTPTKAIIGARLYPHTQAESDAGIAAVDLDLGEPHGKITRYRADPDSATNQSALQAAVNQYSHGGAKVIVPKIDNKRFRSEGVLRCYYNLTTNPDFNSAPRAQGHIWIEGEGRTSVNHFQNSEYYGSVIEFTHATEKGLDINDGATTSGRSFVLTGFSIYGASSDKLLRSLYTPAGSRIMGLFIGNTGAGGAAEFEDIFVALFDDIEGYGNGSGEIITYNPVQTGGGNVIWRNVIGRNGDIGIDIGNAYNGGRTAFIKNHVFIACEGKESRIGLRIRHGAGQLHFIDYWSESNAGATGRGIEISNSAGMVDGSLNPGLIKFDGANLGDSDATAGFVHLELGDDTGTETTDGIGPVEFNSPVFAQVGSNTDAVRRHNSVNNRHAIFRAPLFHNNGGQYFVIDDEAQYGRLIIEDVEPDGVVQGNWVEDTGGTDRSYWCDRLTNLTPVIAGTGTYDYSNAKALPSVLAFSPSGGAITLTLPTAPEEFTSVLINASANANNVILDPGVLNLNGGTTDLTWGGEYSALILNYDDSRGYTVGIAGGQIPNQADAAGWTDATAQGHFNTLKNALITAGIMAE